MTGPLAEIGKAWDVFADGVTDRQVELLRAAANQLSQGYDAQAQRDVEGCAEWRDLNPRENRYAG